MQITINDDHLDPQDSQVIIALTGSRHAIVERLEKIVAECKASYGKPIQGQVWSADVRSHVITPIWKGERY
jgi:hypothetical protein